MSSSATFTIVESSTTMNWPRQTTVRAIQARRETCGADARTAIDSQRSKDHLQLYDDPLMVLEFVPAMGTVHAPGAMVLLTRLAKVVYRRSDADRLGMRLRWYVALSFLNDHDGASQQAL